MAHRFVYRVFRGAIPAGLHIDHRCRNRACVNPWHMEAVPCRVNLLRGVGWGARNATKVMCASGHPFTLENTKYWVRYGVPYRVCVICSRRWGREKYYRNKGAA